MRIKLRIYACLWALLFLPLYGWRSTTHQVRDTLIMGDVTYAINTLPLSQLDSVHYCSLRDRVGFNEFFSWNFRGYVATWLVNDNKLYLGRLNTGSDKADFRDVLKDYKDSRGSMFASWFSGTVICGTGPILCLSGNGLDDLNETEVELTIESGVVTASRKYHNKSNKGTADRYLALQEFTKKFDIRKFPELTGFRIPVKITPSKFDKDGRILDWTVEFMKWPEDVGQRVQNRLARALKKELLKYDWRTYCADGRWIWHERNNFDGVYWAIIFKKEFFAPTKKGR